MSSSEEAPRGPLALLRDRTFGPFMAGKLLSTAGMWVQNLAAAVLMFSLTGSAFMVGLVSALQFVPLLLFSVLTGALTDQFDRRRLLMLGRAISGTAISGLALVLALGGGGVEPSMLLVAVFTTGIGQALSNPAMQALIPALVREQDLEQALAVNAAAPSLARTAGPALGAGLLLVGGSAAAFAVAGASHLTFAFVLAFLRGRQQAKPKTRPSVWGGLRYLIDDPKAGLLVLGVAMLGFGADSVVTLSPPLAAQLGRGDAVVGLFAAAFGVGSVVVTLTFRPLRHALTLRSVGIAGFMVLAAGLLVVGVVPAVVGGAAGFAVAGAGFMMATVALNTRIQRRVPDELRGRVMALWGVAFLGSRPFAAMLNGFLADWFTVRTALIVAAVLTVASTPFALVSYQRRPKSGP